MLTLRSGGALHQMGAPEPGLPSVAGVPALPLDRDAHGVRAAGGHGGADRTPETATRGGQGLHGASATSGSDRCRSLRFHSFHGTALGENSSNRGSVALAGECEQGGRGGWRRSQEAELHQPVKLCPSVPSVVCVRLRDVLRV